MSDKETEVSLPQDLTLSASFEDTCALIPSDALEQSQDFDEWLNENGVQFIITNECLDDNIAKSEPFLNEVYLNESTPAICRLNDVDIDPTEPSRVIFRPVSKTDKNMNSVGDVKESDSKFELFLKHVKLGLVLETTEDRKKWEISFCDGDGAVIIPCHSISLTETGGQTNQIFDRQTVSAVDNVEINSSLDVRIPELHLEDSGGRLWICPLHECRRAFYRFTTAKLHTLVHLGHKPFKCDFENCTWAFYTPFKLRRHMETHLKKKEFLCPIPECNRQFTTIYNLNCHRRLHDRPYNITCLVKGCEKKFQTIRSRESHLKTHGQAEAPYRCTVSNCSRPFFSLTSLTAHTRSHSHKESELRCQWPNCGQKFERPCRLKEHVRKHTGQRPYVCMYEDCKWAFPTASKLKRHQSTHTNDRKFHCTIGTCSKSFLRSEHLKDHTLTHFGQRAFHCDICDVSFSGKSGLCLHVKKAHPNQNKACARALPYSQSPSPDMLLEQAIKSLAVPSDIMLSTSLLPEESLELLQNENFSTVNLRDLE